MQRTATLESPRSNSATNDDLTPSFDELMGVLQYNQGLVEFADSKAGSLILLNSLLIAAVTALPNSGNAGLLKMASVLVASTAMFFCFQVITSRSDSDKDENGPIKKVAKGWEANDFIFFGNVTSFKNGDEYVKAFGRSSCDARRCAILQRSYVIAQIAKRKFAQYGIAQRVTTAAMAVWVAVNVLPFLK